jgi:hypothetical protein
MKKLFTIIVLFLFSFVGKAQSTSPFLDSIQKSLKEKTRFTASINTRNSFVASQRSQVTGYNIGVSFGKKFTVGGGINILNTHIYKIQSFNDDGFTIPMVSKLSMFYMGYFVEYVFYRDKHWELTIPVQLGFGNSFYEYPDPKSLSKNKLLKADKGIVILYEPGMSVTYDVFDWFGVGIDVGCRLMLKNNRHINQQFNSPMYVFNAKVYYGVLYRKFNQAVRKKLDKKK